MEKRFVIAIILSFLVLYVWSLTNPQKSKPLLQNKTSQIIENKEFTENKRPSLDSNTDRPAQLAPSNDSNIKEEPFVAETSKFVASFSSIGGNLKEITLKEYNHTLPVRFFLNLPEFEHVPFVLNDSARNFVSYVYQNNEIKVVKTYHLSNEDNLINVALEITNKTEMSKLMDIKIDSFSVDFSSLDKKRQRLNMLMEYAISHNGTIDRKKNISKFKQENDIAVNDTVNWIGFRDQYYCTIVQPEFETNSYYIESVNEKKARLGMKVVENRIEPNNRVTFESTVYIGPQDVKLLNSYDRGFEKIISFEIGGFFDIMALGLTDKIAKILLILLNFIHKIVPNWGMTIILFAGVIYGITYPFTYKSMLSMKKSQSRMQVIQPELKKIQDKYKSNPKKMQEEIMKIYKKHNFNPLSTLGGCLPMLFQMPIFVSLYQLLWRNYAFKGANFLWIKDLSEPDRLFGLPFNLPYFGNEFNILPILYGLMMFFQQKMQSKNMTVSDPAQAEAQKMMAKIFPVMLGVLFYKFASGLTLYFTVYFLLTTLSHWKMNKTLKMEEQKAA